MDLAALGKLFMLAEKNTNVAQFEILGMRIWPILRIVIMASVKTGKYDNTPEDEAEQALIIAEMQRQVSFGRRPSDAYDPSHLPLKERLMREHLNKDVIRQKTRVLPKVQIWRKGNWKKTQPTAEFRYMEKSVNAARAKFQESSATAGVDIKAEIEALFAGQNPDFLLFASEGAHFHELDGSYLSPIADSWMEELAQYGSIQKILNRPSQRQLHIPGISLTNTESDKCFQSFYIKGIKTPLYADFPIGQFKAFIQLRDEMRKIDPLFDFSVTKLMGYLRGIQKQTYFYELVFRELNPKQIFFVSFSGYIPVIAAAARLGIPSIDLQHGGTPQNHLYLSHYSKPPTSGYSCLPSDLWCWNDETAQGLNQWWKKGARHRAHRVGNPWWSKEREHFHLRDMTSSQHELLEKTKSARSVLVSLVRPPNDTIPEFMVEAIKAAPKDILWNIRLHPLDRANARDFDLLYGDLGQVNVLDATDVPLPLILAHTDVHLTRYSTTWKEAASLGIPTGFWNEEATGFFGDELGLPENKLCLDKRSILDFVANSERGEASKGFSTALDRQLIKTLLK